MYRKIGRGLLSLASVVFVLLLNLSGLVDAIGARSARAASDLEILLFAADGGGWALTAMNSSDVTARLQGEIRLDGAVAAAIMTEFRSPGATWALSGAWISPPAPGTYTAGYQVELRQVGCNNFVAQAEGEITFEVAYDVSVAGACGEVAAEGHAGTAAELRVTGTDANGEPIDITQGVGVGDFALSFARTDPGTYGPHAVSVAAELVVGGEQVAVDTYSGDMICGEAEYGFTSVSGTCGGIAAQGHADTPAELRLTGTDANGDAIDITQQVEGEFSYSEARVDPGTYGPHAVSVAAELVVGGEQVAVDAYSGDLICGEAEYGITSVLGTCSGIAVEGHADGGAELRVTGTDANGDAIDITQQVEGEFSYSEARIDPGTYGPHAVIVAAELMVSGEQVAADSYSGGLICGAAEYGITSVSGTCGGIAVEGHADTPAELQVTGTDANGDAIDITQQVEGDFSYSEARTDPGTYGPHAVSVAAELVVGGEQLAVDTYTGDLICGAAEYGITSVSGTCSGIAVEGHADGTAELRVTGTDANGDAIDITQQVEGDFSYSEARTDPGTYGPHAVSVVAELVVGGEQVAADSYSGDLICGAAEYGITSVSGTCGGIAVEGHADTPAELHVTGTDANGDAIDITQQVEGDFSYSEARTDPGTYGPHAVSVAAELVVGGEQLAVDTYNGDLICGAAEYGITSVSGTCSGIAVDGHADGTAELRVTGTDANGDAIDITQQVEGDFSYSEARTDPGTYGPHAVSVVAELVLGGEQVAVDTYSGDLICGAAETFTVDVTAGCGSVEVEGHSDGAAELQVTGTDANGDAIDITELVEGDFSRSFSRIDPGTYGPHAVSVAAELVVGGEQAAADAYSGDLICGAAEYGIMDVSGTCSGIAVQGYADTAAELNITGTDANGDAVDITEQVDGEFSYSYSRTDPGTYGPHAVSVAVVLSIGGEQVAADAYNADLICGAAEYAITSVSGTCGGIAVQGHADSTAELRVTGTDANGDAIDIMEQVQGQFSYSYSRTDPGTYGPHAVSVEAELVVGGEQVAADTYTGDLICGEAETFAVSVSAGCGAVEVQGHADGTAELRVTGTDANGDAIDITQQVEGDFFYSFSRTDPGTYGPHAVSVEAQLHLGDSLVAGDSFSGHLICGEAQASACYSTDVPDRKLPKGGDELTVCAVGEGGQARLMNLTDDEQVGEQEAVGGDGRVCFTRHLYPEVKYQIQYQGDAGGWSSAGCTFTFGKKIHHRGDLYMRKSVVAPCGAIAAMVEHYAESDDWKLVQIAEGYHLVDLRTVDGQVFDRTCQAYGGPASEVEVWGAGFKAHLASSDGQAVYVPEYFSADGYDGVAGNAVWDENIGQVFGVLSAEFPPVTVDGHAIQSPFAWMAEQDGLSWQGEVVEGKPMADQLGLVCPRVQLGAGVYCGWIRNRAGGEGEHPGGEAPVETAAVSYGRATESAAPVVNSLTLEGHEARDVVQLDSWDGLPAAGHFGLSPDGRVIGGHLDDAHGSPDVGAWISGMEVGDRAGLGVESYVAVKKLLVRQSGDPGSDLQSIADGLEDGQRA
ncbi:MAG: hypothetical protein PVH41_03635, partial [Anaerolineae bacterium]